MATYNEIHPNASGDNHNTLYMVVGIILALVIAGFAFYYYTDGSTSTTTDSAGTMVERVIEPAGGNDAATESNSMNLSIDDDGVNASSMTTQQ